MRILVVYGKHGKSHYNASTLELKYNAALYILKQNQNNGFYVESALDFKKVDDIIKAKDGKKAYHFLMFRSYSDFEYERIEEVHLKTIK